MGTSDPVNVTTPSSSKKHQEESGSDQPPPESTEYSPEKEEYEKTFRKEVQEVEQGQYPFTTMTNQAEATIRRKVAKNLEGLEHPGVARASEAASVEHPRGTENGPQTKMGKHRTVLQQHCDFFDRDNDGVITMWDTYNGFRRLGFNIPFSLLAIVIVNPAFSLVSSPHWYPDWRFRVFTANIHKGKHGSDQEVFDTEGRYIPQKFEDIFTKWDRDKKGGLNLRDLWEMTQSTRMVNDFFGWFAGKFEWFTAWLLAADERGLLTKEAARGIYDGSIFYELEKKVKQKKPQQQQEGETAIKPEYEGFGNWNKSKMPWSTMMYAKGEPQHIKQQ